jgi:hypothetical protein
MPERILTDENGDRWDVRETGDGRLTFRHQSGRELAIESTAGLDAISSDRLRGLLADAREAAGEPTDGGEHALDPEGYSTN